MVFSPVELYGWNSPITTRRQLNNMTLLTKTVSSIWDDSNVSVSALLNRISELDTTKSKGDVFEYLVKLYFVVSDIVYYQWSELANDLYIRRKLNSTSRDMGIDGVIITQCGEHTTYTAVQCKYRKRGAISVPWKELSTFIGSAFGVYTCYSSALVITSAQTATRFLHDYADRVEFWVYSDIISKFSEKWTTMYNRHIEWCSQLNQINETINNRVIDIYSQLKIFKYEC